MTLYELPTSILPISSSELQGLRPFTYYEPFHVQYLNTIITCNLVFSARCNIYISHLCYDVSVRLSVRLSVMGVHWRIIDNLGFKFRSQFTVHCGRGACGR